MDEEPPTDGTVRLSHQGLPVRSLSATVLTDGGAPDALTSKHDITFGSAEGNDVVLSDPTVSAFHACVSRGSDGLLVRDLGSTNGTSVGTVRFHDAAVVTPPGSVLAMGHTRVRIDDGSVVLVDHGDTKFGAVLGVSPPMRRIFATLRRLAPSDMPSLILGESGTGKERVARAIHDASARANGPWEVVDCGALTPQLFASELFGHVRGSFTGATRDHVGAFARASGGTLFLDEVGDLPPEIQSALLGALERKRVRPVGSKTDVPIDVRVIAATSRDLRKAVNANAFRLDLYYRLAVVLLELPPLRARPEDIPILAEHFLREVDANVPLASILPAEELARLMTHDWPGNARELRNTVLSALTLGTFENGDATEMPSFRQAKRAAVDAFEAQYLRKLLESTSGNVRAAARAANMDRKYLTQLLARHQLK
ncbi:MAG: sigma 54-interacting transcriptional regulator [Myxococcota bacterium]